ncbi:TadE/TadG family type IV pilus assembly protein [Chengkuizengella axinellae]|uniref:TadE/TadG family type IV pilus assembly protein n=1 Tax=Chengkuizengella axinellae TaxID=3064388 RepID=A0ABT9J3B8_9BACL|nr:TadE/TadG family type IV pilus assembly protein [Chengkuizengella sp. 2205SS18-9]MDP5276115.1 TadE/TadG family type IV pilus assembly protein [Chengkuizengella sp. 2205SS18-9]
MKIFKCKKGSLMDAALVLPLLVLIIAFVFDMGIRMIVLQGTSAASREAARDYARFQDETQAIQIANGSFNSLASSLADVRGVDIDVSFDGVNDYATVTVTTELTADAFSFVWSMMGSDIENEMERSIVYPIEIKDGSQDF